MRNVTPLVCLIVALALLSIAMGYFIYDDYVNPPKQITIEDGRRSGRACRVDRFLPRKLTCYRRSYSAGVLHERITIEVGGGEEKKRTFGFENGELCSIERQFDDTIYIKTPKDPEGLFAGWKKGLVDGPNILQKTRERFSDVFPR